MDGGWKFCSFLCVQFHTHTLYTLFTQENFPPCIRNLSTRTVSISIYLKGFLWSTENLFWRPIPHHSKQIFKSLWLLWTNIMVQMAASGWPCLGKGENEGKWGYYFTPQFPHFSDTWFSLHWVFPHQTEFPAFLKIIVICYSHFSKGEQLRAYKHTLYVYFICTIFQSQALNSLRKECSHYCSHFAQALLLQQMLV